VGGAERLLAVSALLVCWQSQGRMLMRKLVVSEFMSLDGVIQAPGGAEEDTEGGFTQGGWTQPYWHDDIGAHFFQTITECGAFLQGRKTWQIHGGAFEPIEGDDFADVMNAMPKYVVSTTLPDASAWRNSTLIASDVVEAVRALKAEEGKDIYVDGSSVLAHTLAQHGLVDEYSLLVYPIVLGNGKRLFPDGLPINLRLLESRPFPSGVVLMRYAAEQPV
jgi:dihydrofolate reductase